MKIKIFTLFSLILFFFSLRFSYSQDFTWLDFDGTDDYLSAGQDNILAGKSQFTIEMRVHFNDPYNYSTLLSQFNSETTIFKIVYNGSNNQIFLLFDEFNYAYGYFYPSTQIYNLSIVYNGAGITNEDKLKFYIDGVSQFLYFDEATIPSNTNTPAIIPSLVIGCEEFESSTYQFFNGQIGELVFWDYPLTEGQIQSRIDSEVTGIEPGLIDYFHFSEGVPGGDNTAIISIIGGKIYSTVNPVNFQMMGLISNFVGRPCTISPAIISDPYENKEVCGSSILGSQSVMSGVGYWEIIGGTGIIENSLLNYTTATNLASGINMFRWTVSDGICSDYDEVSVINNTIEANGGGPYGNALTCEQFFTLNAVNPAPANGTWAISPGDMDDMNVWIENPGLYNTRIRTFAGIDAADFDFDLIWTVNNGECFDYDTITVTNHAIAYAGPDFSQSGMNNYTMAAFPTTYTEPAMQTYGIWDYSNGGLGGVNLYSLYEYYNTAQFEITNTAVEDVYSLIWTYQYYDGGAFTCVSKDTVDIYYVNDISGINITAGTNQNICGFETVLTGATDPSTVGLNTVGFWSGPAGVVFNPINSPVTSVSGLMVGENILTWTISNGASMTSAQVSVFSEGVYAFADNQWSCSPFISLYANDPSIFGGTGIWTKIAGNGTILVPTDYNTYIDGVSSGTTSTLVWTVSANTCSASATITVTNNSINISAGADALICDDQFQMMAQAPTVGTGYWENITAMGTFDNMYSYNSWVRDLMQGENIFAWHIMENGCNNSDTIIITNSLPSEAIIYTENNYETCDGNVSLNANFPTFGTGSWSQIAGGGTIEYPFDYMTNATYLSPDNNLFRWTVQNGSCMDYADVTIINNQVISNAGGDQLACDNFTNLYAIDPSTTMYGGTGMWYSEIAYAFTDVNDPLTSVSGLFPGLNSVIWDVTKGTCFAKDTVEITVVDIFATANNQSACSPDFVLDGNDPSQFGGTGLWTILSGDGSLLDAATWNSLLTGVTNETTTSLRWTVFVAGCEDYYDITITNNNFSISAGPDQDICMNETYLSGQNPLPGTGYWSTIAGYGDILEYSLYNTIVQNVNFGTNIFSWNVYKNGCNASDQLIITNSSASEAYIYTMEGYESCDGTVYLDAQMPSFGVGEWDFTSGYGNIQSPSNYSTFVNNLGMGNSTFIWTVTNGICTNSAQVNVVNNQVTSNAGTDQFVCENYTTLDANNPLLATGTWTAISGNANFQNPNLYNTLVTELAYGGNTLDWTVINGSCMASSQVIITTAPVAIQAYAGEDKYICQNSTFLEGNDPTPYMGYWMLTAGVGTIVEQTLYNSDYINVGYGANTLVWSISDGTCISRDTVIITYTDLPVIYAGSDETFWSEVEPSPSVGYQLNATPVEFPFIGFWTSNNQNDIIENPSLSNSMATYLHPGMHHFTWTVSLDECYGYDDVDIMARISIINSGNKIGEWQATTSWIPEVIPTQYDSVTITNGAINLIGTTGNAYQMVIKNSGTLTIKGDAAKGEGILYAGDLYVFEDVIGAKGNSNLYVYSGGRANVEQSIDKSLKGGTGNLYVRSGGRANVEQGIDKLGGSPVLTVASQIFVEENNPDLTDPTALFFIGENGEVQMPANTGAKIADRLIISNGGVFEISQNAETVNPALSILGGGNIVIENQSLTKAGTPSTLKISGGRANVEQGIDKGATGSLKVYSGGRANVEQDIDKLGNASYISVPQLNIVDGNVLIGNIGGGATATCTLNSSYITIDQTTENTSGEPNFVVAAGGILDLVENTAMGNTSYIEVGDSASVEFLDDAEIITDNPEMIVIEIDEDASVIDSTDAGNIIDGYVVVNQIFNEGIQLFSTPLSEISSDDLINETLSEWIEPDALWSVLTSGTNLLAMNGYKLESTSIANEELTGIFNPAQVSVILTNSDLSNQNEYGWNLIGNPFTSALDFELIPLAGIENSLYKFDPLTQNYKIYQQGGVSINGGDQLIELSEGFFVKLNPGLPVVNLTLGAGKVHNVPGLLTLEENSEKVTNETLNLTLTDGTNSDETVFALENGKSLDFESNNDIFKLLAEIPQIFTSATDGENLAYNIFDVNNEEVVIVPLNILSSQSGNYTINSNLQLTNTGIKVYLDDLQSEDELVNLREVTTYDFSFNSTEAQHRFDVIFDYTTVGFDVNSTEKVKIYSSDNKFVIRTFENITYKVEIYSLTGSKVMETEIYGKNIHTITNINVEGLYVVKVTGNGTLTSESVFVR